MDLLVAIVGPTGIGKSKLALNLAPDFNGEIINGDSRQIYRYLDIGTAKPSPKERSRVPHHLVDIMYPDEDFSLAQYQDLVRRSIRDINERGGLPFLVGGSGQYIWSVLEGWQIPKVPPNLELRRSLEQEARESGKDALYQELLEADPVAARRIGNSNVRRIIRALEVVRSTGMPISSLQKKDRPVYRTLIIGLTTGREELYQRIDRRVDRMIESGLVAEVERLLTMGYRLELPAMSSIGYRQIGLYLKGELTLPQAIEQIKSESHRYVRQQYNWFRLNDKRIKWFDVKTDPAPDVRKMIVEFLNKIAVRKEDV